MTNLEANELQVEYFCKCYADHPPHLPIVSPGDRLSSCSIPCDESEGSTYS